MTGRQIAGAVARVFVTPRPAVRALRGDRRAHAVAMAAGAAFGLLQSGRAYLAGADMRVFVFGAAAGLGGLFLFALLLRNFGRWFGATAEVAEVRTALGLGLLPWTLLFLVLLPWLGGMDAEAGERVYPFFFAGLVYGYAVLLLAAAEGLGFGVLKTFWCLLATGLVCLFPATLVLRLAAGG